MVHDLLFVARLSPPGGLGVCVLVHASHAVGSGIYIYPVLALKSSDPERAHAAVQVRYILEHNTYDTTRTSCCFYNSAAV